MEVQWNVVSHRSSGLSHRADAVVCSCESCSGTSLHLQEKSPTACHCLGRGIAPQCPDPCQSCRDVALNTKSRVANSWCCSCLGIQHHQAWLWTPKCSGVPPYWEKAGMAGRASQCPSFVLSQFLKR